ncbi:flagellar export protein FliJ [Acidovorax sp. LjRoot118]|uniref:flagellar export protein FliJ n=1 Tax=unclassified Acidovorax TaxID=2684926 RepID=UPI00070CDF3D|nr:MULTISPECIES: flagellar export protein FliJ [unclassified Acidovorax]KRC18463.1 flagellar export protein FliJ [Acidovorax sp. Root217]KRC21256.1 flagellar export protein FliJ [Acidovorax sp. Root219]
MSVLSALIVAVEIAARKRDEARRVLQEALAVQQAAQAQLHQLQDYARETEQRWGMQADTRVQPEVMYHHYQFMDRLGHAAGLQTSVVGDQEARVENARRGLMEAEQRLASLRKVVEQRRRELEQAQARMEQKQTDERAAMQYSRRVQDR